MSKFTTPTESKLNNARLAILLIVVFSIVNIFAIAFAEMYFLFSAYLPQVFISIGIYSGSEELFLGMVILSLIYVFPYLLCWIFSKKRVGWMIAALVLFSIDSVFFFIDLPLYLEAGDFSFIMDLVMRIYALGCLIMGVVYGLKKGKEDAAAEAAPPLGADEMPLDMTRSLTITRKKSFIGCAATLVVYVNKQEVGKLKNGGTLTVDAPANTFELGVSFSNGMVGNSTVVAQGTAPLRYEASMKIGFAANTILLTPLS